jgi:predicted PurR-regulated permease PerM
VARYFSFILLLGVIGVLSVLFYRVMAIFLVPIFLAMLLVVIFRPMHVWYTKKIPLPSIAALATTASILLLVLAPLSLLFVLAANEGRMAARRFSSDTLLNGALKLRDTLQLTLPELNELRGIELHLEKISTLLDEGDNQSIENELKLTTAAAKRFADKVQLPLEIVTPETDSPLAMFRSATKVELWSAFLFNLDRFKKLFNESQASSQPSAETTDNDASESNSIAADIDAVQVDQFQSLHQANRETIYSLDEFSTLYCGGKSWAWLKRMANPSRDEVSEYAKQLRNLSREQLLTIGGATTVYVGRTIFGLFIMIISLYFFLLDGPKMITAMRRLSPLDDEHEKELIQEFERVSRAVVVATLSAALVQGLLAGFGFFIVGLDNVFLLSMLTVCFAMIPFFGAASIWLPCCIWLAFVENRLGAAIGLGIYGAVIVSLADNIIKPYVLHGQSNIHPLVALLSVLGGVGALGPIGILIGPMVVAFLQTLLKILQRELTQMEKVPESLASGSGAAAISGTPEKRPILSGKKKKN